MFKAIALQLSLYVNRKQRTDGGTFKLAGTRPIGTLTSGPLSLIQRDSRSVVNWPHWDQQAERKTQRKHISTEIILVGLSGENTHSDNILQHSTLIKQATATLRVTYYAKSTCSRLFYINTCKEIQKVSGKRFSPFYIKTCLKMS